MAGGGKIPDPNKAAIQGIQQQAQDFPFEYIINALSQLGESGTLTPPGSTTPQTFDFTGLGTADVQNKMSDQMAQTLLEIQNGLGPQFVAQRLADLKQADPQGYAARQQLFDQIMQEVNSPAPNSQLSESTQTAVNKMLQDSSTLNADERMQVEQGARAGQVQSGIFLGNAPEQVEANAVIGATDQKRQAGEAAANQYLAAGVSPEDIQFRSIQQDLEDLGAFLSGQTPTSQFASLSGAQAGAAPYPNTGYQSPGLNEGQGAQQGVQNAFGIYGSEVNNPQANPYLVGLNLGSNVAGTAFDLGWKPWASPNPGTGNIQTTPTGGQYDTAFGFG